MVKVDFSCGIFYEGEASAYLTLRRIDAHSPALAWVCCYHNVSFTTVLRAESTAVRLKVDLRGRPSVCWTVFGVCCSSFLLPRSVQRTHPSCLCAHLGKIPYGRLFPAEPCSHSSSVEPVVIVRCCCAPASRRIPSHGTAFTTRSDHMGKAVVERQAEREQAR